MKVYNAIILATLGTLALSGCFKDEPQNAECDIEAVSVHVARPEEIFFNLSDTLQQVLSTADSIGFGVKRTADVTALAPKFQLTPGATITPGNGSVHDFSNGPVAYTVTSEDRQWQRHYKVAFVPVMKTVSDTLAYDFDIPELPADKPGYYNWNTENTGGETQKWATGNPGFNLTNSKALPADYPSARLADGYDGPAVRLMTRDTGPFGQMANMRLAAGNLFLGTFDISQALVSALKATAFGVKFDRKPVKFSGYYRYTPGPKFQDRSGKTVEGKVDKGDIYSVLYRNHDDQGNPVTLNGENVLSSSQIVAIARVDNIETTSEWKRFEVDYTYLSALDPALLEQYGYSLTIVFTSSSDGAFFEGAIGSTLDVDKVRVVCEKTE